MDESLKARIAEALRLAGGSTARAAAVLGWSRRTMLRRMHEGGFEIPKRGAPRKPPEPLAPAPEKPEAA